MRRRGDDPVMDVDDASSTPPGVAGSSDSDSDYDSDELSAYPASLDGRSDSRVAGTRILTSPSRQLSGTGAETSSKPRIEGGVAVFVHSDGSTSEMPVSEYVEELRSEVDLLRSELTRTSAGSNPLIAFMANMEPANLSALTANAGEEVVEAMRKIVEAVVKREGLQPRATRLWRVGW
ncbi:hypothetical protein I4F81_005221 [Pyropia yezoensis]|uniref:Uncharacterized protein n=1 Tax=Pyropia yezoensis TaxID=2788 RepID=A0ACC3BYK5_PYRYE|nr:hypothetical protein I4F81_005221 [Neopyropia yezoensis]